MMSWKGSGRKLAWAKALPSCLPGGTEEMTEMRFEPRTS
jgi:hypothetical protein